ncbi:MAG: carboxypeptidase-like regulatory domain-containing protein [Bacteroidales bacterium]|nr:carboxypeptidase-like regulatory domain-containing protein [Bacteroidales bacterium]
MKRLLFILILFFICAIINAQSFTVSGKITDKTTGQPVSDIHISVFGKKTGAISDKNGNYKINLENAPATLLFTHINYHDFQKTIKEKKDLNLNLSLEKRTYMSDTVVITKNRIYDMIEKKPLYVWDYDFYGDSILLLACKYRKINQPLLVLMTNSGDTVTTYEVSKPERIFRDCLDNLHLVTKKYAYQIFYDSSNLQLLYQMETSDFDSLFPRCLEATINKFYFKEYYLRNQVLIYFSMNKEDGKHEKIRVIGDEAGLERLAFNNRFWAMGPSPNESDLRFEQMCFFDPIFAPLVKLGDSLIILNYVDGKMEFLTENGDIINEIPISFHKNKNWKEEIFVDEIAGKVYSLFKQNGITSVMEINLKTGELGKEIKIPDFVHIENIKIRNNILFFLYIEKNGLEYKKLYKMYIN